MKIQTKHNPVGNKIEYKRLLKRSLEGHYIRNQNIILTVKPYIEVKTLTFNADILC